MAQTLKEQSRNDIIEAAKEEFLDKGYKDASLRNIAKKAHMTVGNLYRYFKNKEDINRRIVGETLDMLEKMLSELTDNKVSFEAHVFNIRMDNRELIEKLDTLADRMVSIYEKHRIEFRILMMHSKLNDEITDWFAGICKTIILENYDLKEGIIDLDRLSHSYAVSIFAGLRDLFESAGSDTDELKNCIRVFFRSHVYMLNTDIRSFTGDIL